MRSITPSPVTATILPFPGRVPRIDFEPDAQAVKDAYVAICITWQFAHLDAGAMDRATEELILIGGAAGLVTGNSNAIKFLFKAVDFLIEADTRLRDSLDRVAAKMEARQ